MTSSVSKETKDGIFVSFLCTLVRNSMMSRYFLNSAPIFFYSLKFEGRRVFQCFTERKGMEDGPRPLARRTDLPQFFFFFPPVHLGNVSLFAVGADAVWQRWSALELLLWGTLVMVMTFLPFPLLFLAACRGANSLKTSLARWANQFWNWLAHHKIN